MQATAGLGPVSANVVPTVLACDRHYAMPLATTLRSLVDSNQRHWPLEVYVLTDEFPEVTRTKVVDSLPPHSANVHWREIDLSDYDHLAVKSHMTPMTFARLQVTDVFAGSYERILYLDTDILVLGDLDELWHAELGNAPLGAVRDHHVDANLKACRFDHLVGVPRVKNYFNAGVLLIDPTACKRRNFFQAASEYQHAHPISPYCDQDGLNMVFDGLWHELDGKWNFQNHHTTRVARLPLAQRPAIVHFITGYKPWKPSSTSINSGLYTMFRKRTLFALSPAESAAFSAMSLIFRARNRLLRILGRACE